MVTCVLKGRRGNQYFIAAAAIAYALKHDLDLHIPDHTLDDQAWPPLITDMVNPDFKERPVVTLKEEHFNYRKLPFDDSWRFANICLDGYYQSYKYFEGYRKEILSAFRLQESTREGWTGIHVRRGDYLKYPTMHPVVTARYIREAVELMPGRQKFMICSDDMAWCKKYLDGLLFGKRYFEYAEGGSEWDDLVSLMRCEHLIISNSTFGWWAAWANSNPSKIVITPGAAKWFGVDYSHMDTSDLIPREWIQLT
jgi:hypothetical protein